VGLSECKNAIAILKSRKICTTNTGIPNVSKKHWNGSSERRIILVLPISTWGVADEFMACRLMFPCNWFKSSFLESDRPSKNNADVSRGTLNLETRSGGGHSSKNGW